MHISRHLLHKNKYTYRLYIIYLLYNRFGILCANFKIEFNYIHGIYLFCMIAFSRACIFKAFITRIFVHVSFVFICFRHTIIEIFGHIKLA